jgi:transcriptional regulator with XRE-family HTH domain
MAETRGDHLYVESGLDNVLLHGIPIFECEKGHRLPTIPNLSSLHDAIAQALVEKQARLAGREVRFLRKHMGLKAVELARLLGLTKQRISQLENERDVVSNQTDRLIRAAYALKSVEENGEVSRIVTLVRKVLPHIGRKSEHRQTQFWNTTPELRESLRKRAGVAVPPAWISESQIKELTVC